jgi:hypothetical protein
VLQRLRGLRSCAPRQILDDSRESMHHKDEHHTVFFQKLEVLNTDEVFSLLEFSREQLIHNSTFVQKELLRSLERENITIRTQHVYRLNRELAGVVGEEFVTVLKEYVLMAEEGGLMAVVSNEPLRYVFKEVFFEDYMVSSISENPDYRGKDLCVEFKREMVYHLLYELKMQNVAQLVWELFYFLINESRSSRENLEFVGELFHAISYILLSPIGFVWQLQHSLRCVKWQTLPSFPVFSEKEAYATIIVLEKEVTAFVQRGSYVYWELELFYEAIKLLLSIIVDFKQLKVGMGRRRYRPSTSSSTTPC